MVRSSSLLLGTLLLALGCGSAAAISRYESNTLSCPEARSLVQREGAVIFRFQSQRVSGLPLYDRFVVNSSFCASGEETVPKAVPTRSGSCTLLVCRPFVDEDFFGFSR